MLVILNFKAVYRHLPLMLHAIPKDQMVGIIFPLQLREENSGFTKPWQLTVVTHRAGASAWLPDCVLPAVNPWTQRINFRPYSGSTMHQVTKHKESFQLQVLVPWWFRSKGSASDAEDTGDQGSIPGSGRSPGEGNGNHSSILAWRIPWTEEPDRLQTMGSQRVGHDWSDCALAHVLCLTG